MAERLGPVDALRALACLCIVGHHLAFYGPMPQAARVLAPALIDWLAADARMAVQVFLVVSGFLLARSLPPGRALSGPWPKLVGRRYLRLLVPYAAALIIAILVALAVRAWGEHPAVPERPTWPQLIAHLLMLQDLVGEEALSAGVWYVAIDLQLFALAAALCALCALCPPRSLAPRAALLAVAAVAVMTAASLWVFNRDARLDVTALYFFGAYGMGLLAGWATCTPRPLPWLAAIAALGLTALALDWRGRIALALATALLLGLAQAFGAMRWQPRRWGAWLAAISYPVFLVHFSVLLAVGALWAHWWPQQPVANALGMLAALALSLAAGAGLHRLERGVSGPRMALGWYIAVLTAGWLAMKM